VTSKGHRRLEVRTTSSQLIDFLDRPFLQQVFQRERTTISKTGKTRHPIVYGVTSLSAQQASPGQLLTMLRSSWHIENSLHYPRDVTLHEDQTRFKKPSAAHPMAILHNLVLALIPKAQFPFVPSARRFCAAHPNHALALFLSESPALRYTWRCFEMIITLIIPCASKCRHVNGIAHYDLRQLVLTKT
jgi:predicted transposase YbfD/YdcC